MNICEIMTADCANGPGMRVTVFVSGCTNHCKGCFQPETWDFDYGTLFDGEREKWIVRELTKGYYDGLTLLGGEPMEPSNQEGILPLIRRVKTELPGKTVWVYTGFTYDKDLVPGGRKYTEVTDEILDSIDVLVDGQFILREKDITLQFRGSRNQRIIDMKATRASGEVVLSPLQESPQQKEN